MSDTDTASKNENLSVIPSINSYNDFYDFLAKHSVYKTNDNNKKEITNTRIGDSKQNIHGGSYHISDAEYNTFLELYRRDIVSKNKKEQRHSKTMNTKEENPYPSRCLCITNHR